MRPSDKIKLYRSLFRGREDVFARRWDKNGSYFPDYTFDWSEFNAHKARGGTIKDFENKKLTPLTNEVTGKHLLGLISIGIPVYFADPYSSWQRGANENSNRQIRAYLPKRSDIRDLTQKELDNIAWDLNNKPRIRLNWHTPQEDYDWLVQNPGKQLDLSLVAFGSRI